MTIMESLQELQNMPSEQLMEYIGEEGLFLMFMLGELSTQIKNVTREISTNQRLTYELLQELYLETQDEREARLANLQGLMDEISLYAPEQGDEGLYEIGTRKKRIHELPIIGGSSTKTLEQKLEFFRRFDYWRAKTKIENVVKNGKILEEELEMLKEPEDDNTIRNRTELKKRELEAAILPLSLSLFSKKDNIGNVELDGVDRKNNHSRLFNLVLNRK